MHSSVSPHGGDLKHDTVAIIGRFLPTRSLPPAHLTYYYFCNPGHTLDLQEKVVKDAMTPIANVFMLPLDARLDYATLRKVCESGHSRVPVYEEIEVPVYKEGDGKTDGGKVKKIVGILLVKQCVLLDPKGT
jgi:metal transporter CNNM